MLGFSGHRAPSDQIEQWVEEDPDDVDQVPIERAELERRGGAVCESAPRGAYGEAGEHPETDPHMDRGKAGHEKVERIEEMGACRLHLRVMVVLARQRALFELVQVFD